MKRLFIILLILVVAVLVGVQMKTNPGYVLITTNHIALETRLWFAIACLVVLFCVLYGVLRGLSYVASMPRRWRQWRAKKHTQKATESTYQGLMNLAEGDWHVAQKELLKAIDHAPAPLVNYLAAAIAAQRDGEREKRDRYLSQATEKVPKATLAIGLVQAQLQYDAAQYELALMTLKKISVIAPKHKQVLALLAKVYKKLGDWPALAELLPYVQDYHALPSSQITHMAVAVYQHLFCQVSELSQLKQLWKHAPSAIRAEDEVGYLYIKALDRLGEADEADRLTCHTLKEQWNPELVRFYGKLATSHPKKQLAHAEGWLKTHPRDPNLLFTLARLAESNKLWGKAKDYYVDSLQLSPDPEVYGAYANLLEQLGEVKESLVYYRKGLRASF